MTSPTSRRGIPAGERFADADEWEARGADQPHIWRTLGYRRVGWSPGETTVEWDAPPDYCFPTSGGPVVQGGLVTALLDAAMGGACWTVLDRDQAFLTADLRVEFLRTTTPGTLRASGEVVRRTRRVVFCAGGAARRERRPPGDQSVHAGRAAGHRSGRPLRPGGARRRSPAGRARMSDAHHLAASPSRRWRGWATARHCGRRAEVALGELHERAVRVGPGCAARRHARVTGWRADGELPRRWGSATRRSGGPAPWSRR